MWLGVCFFLQRKHASDCTVFPPSPLKPASTECWLSAVMHTSEAHYSLFFLSPAPLPHPSNSVFSEQLSHSRLPSPNAVCTAWYGVSAFPTQTQKKTRLPVPQAKFEWSQNTWASSRQGSQIFVTLVSNLHPSITLHSSSVEWFIFDVHYSQRGWKDVL